MRNITTMKHIAERAQVSLGTVSNVVNGTTPVREHLRERVLEAIRTLGYQPSQLARGLRRNSTNMLGMVIPDITNPFFPGVVRGVEDVAFKGSYRVVLCNTDNDPAKEQAYLDELRSYRPAGLLVIPAVESNLAAELGLPMPSHVAVVCIDRRPADWKGDAVLAANEEGAFQATEHLLNMGHTRVASICGPSHVTTALERLAGFRKALAKQGVRIPPEYIQEAKFDRESGYRSAMCLLTMSPRPTAIFAANDLVALGALMAARELGLNCPKDVSVIGFDNLDIGMFTDPALSSVHQPGYQMGARAARLILERIKGKKGRAQQIVLPAELRLRNSVAPPPRGE
ncbi:MAG: LacI family DNA-binding transcriptional regulator [Candidatus Acidiferrales bacterium]